MNDSCVVVIRAWLEGSAFRARMIVQPREGSAEDPDLEGAQVVVTDSIDMLCESLRAVLEQRSR